MLRVCTRAHNLVKEKNTDRIIMLKKIPHNQFCLKLTVKLLLEITSFQYKYHIGICYIHMCIDMIPIHRNLNQMSNQKGGEPMKISLLISTE